MSPVDTIAKIITADPEVAAKYRADGWWSDERHADRIRKLAAERPNDPAYITETARFTWKDYDQASERVAAALLELGLKRGDRVAVVLPTGRPCMRRWSGSRRPGWWPWASARAPATGRFRTC